MRKFFIFCMLAFINVFCLFNSVNGQTPPSDLTGEALRVWLKGHYHDGIHVELTYSTARMYLYNHIDNHNNSIECVYSGYTVDWEAGGTGTNPYPINCEHSIPQSFFSSQYPMQSDLNHLFPTYHNWNSTRNNHPFNDIPDGQTTKWMFDTNHQSNIPTSNIDAYSEYKAQVFEPREAHKGNVARAIFYFYTMYPTEAGNMSQVADINVLYQWHLNDPVTSTERARNEAIASFQGSKNPYIEQPDLILRAWPNIVLPSNDPVVPDNVIISEYVEGSSYNKAIELANIGEHLVDLSAYTLHKQANGTGEWSGGLALSGQLAPGEVFVICHASAASELRSIAQLYTKNTELNFNGNDPIALFKEGILVDAVGTFNAGSADMFGQDVTLVRKSDVQAANTNYVLTEWENLPRNTFTNIGKHGEENTTNDNAGNVTTLATLIISEYVEGSSYNKAIELTNASTQNIDLSNYSLHKQTNGAGEWSGALSLSGILAPGETFVVCHTSAGSELAAQADLSINHTVLNFNGNDPIALFKEGVLLDMVGTFNNTALFGKDRTLIRNANVNSANTVYTTSEWTVQTMNSFSNVGIHTLSSGKKNNINHEFNYQLFPNPSTDVLTLNFDEAAATLISLQVFNINGAIVYNEMITNKNTHQIVVNNWKNGMYIIRCQSGNNVKTLKFTKQ